jgi:hypothetical protein
MLLFNPGPVRQSITISHSPLFLLHCSSAGLPTAGCSWETTGQFPDVHRHHSRVSAPPPRHLFLSPIPSSHLPSSTAGTIIWLDLTSSAAVPLAPSPGPLAGWHVWNGCTRIRPGAPLGCLDDGRPTKSGASAPPGPVMHRLLLLASQVDEPKSSFDGGFISI